MRIGIDARFLGPAGTGIGRYTQRLLENLEQIDKENEYSVFLRRENFNLYKTANRNFRKVLADIPWYGIREQTTLPGIFKREELDLLHALHFNVPILYRGKFVVTIHDLIKTDWGGRGATTKSPLEYQVKRLGYHLVIRSAVGRAKKILTPSNYVKNRVVEVFGVDPGKVVVTYEAGTLLGKGRTAVERKVEDVLG
ncbi:MAG: glycosyltransferase, partial [Candidatus Aenigmarchaeota archaeon]|nr:glycosyltransferase [Candidatus Aenigmarchaeota archaeon]